MKRTFIMGMISLPTLIASGCVGLDAASTQGGESELGSAPPSDLGPPPEAIEACRDLAAGEPCRVELGEHAIDGTCLAGPGGDVELACAPSGPPPGEPAHRGPPPEALDACRDRSAGDACSVALPARSIGGACRSGLEGEGPLACAPSHMPPPPPTGARRPPPEALEACADLAAGAACTVNLPAREIDGLCRPGPDGEGPLACAPSAPPIGPDGARIPGRPPHEAIHACAGLARDAECTFELGGRTVQGTCWAPPEFAGAPLACAPPEIRGSAPPR